MKIVHEGVEYNTVYFPFFRSSRTEEYRIRYPSGITSTISIMSEETKYQEFEAFLLYLLREYALEDDDALTERARRKKDDVRRLFNLD